MCLFTCIGPQPFSPSVIEAKEKSVTEKEQRVQREMKALKEKERIIAMKKTLAGLVI